MNCRTSGATAVLVGLALSVSACSTNSSTVSPSSSGTVNPSSSGAVSPSSSGASTPTTSSSAGDVGSGSVKGDVTYWLWQANQQPAYQACADAFHTANPGANVKIEQYGWSDYWDKLTTSLASGSGPDVFTDHLAKYADFVAKKQILPLDDFVNKDNTPTNIYQPGLADLWVHSDGKRYGLPKDFDTVAYFYNAEMLKSAGISKDDASKWTWNPDDGGTLEKAIAHLTIDKNGKRGDEAGFDKNNVKTYGLSAGEGSGGPYGQQFWSAYAASTGWQFTDKNPWGSHYNYDDPRFQKTIGWYRSLIAKGYMNSLASTVGSDPVAQFGAGKFAMQMNGDWASDGYFALKGVKVDIAPTPIGPTGKRASMYNGLSDAINATTPNKDAAWAWVKFLASPDCQNMVGDKGVVFPAIPSATEKAQAAFKAHGVDVDGFLVHVKDKSTFLFPITDHAADVNTMMSAQMDAILGFKADPSSLTQANEKVNALFK